MGVKKSTVATIARSGVNWYTAASSRVEASTRMRGSVSVGTWRKTCANSAGPSLQAQPAPCENAVRRTIACADIVRGRWRQLDTPGKARLLEGGDLRGDPGQVPVLEAHD